MSNNAYGIIYKITNLVNDKIYIGLTTQMLRERIKEHLFNASHNSNYLIHRSIRKNGIDNFNISIIDQAYSKDELDDREVFWINYYKSCIHFDECNGYNMTFGGDGFGKGVHHPRFGKIVSEDTRDKMSKSRVGRFKGENHPTARAVVQFSLDGDFIEEHVSATEGAKVVGGDNRNITSCCRGKKKTAYGYIWKYKEDGE